jgi:hypothetical protein
MHFCVEQMIAHGLVVNHQGHYPSPVFISMFMKNKSMFELLRSHGAHLEQIEMPRMVEHFLAFDELEIPKQHRQKYIDEKDTFFSYLIDVGNVDLVKVIESGRNGNVVQLLLDKKAFAIEQPLFNGMTPLTYAAARGNVSALQVLVKNGAKVRTKMQFSGKTALHVVMNNKKESWNIVTINNTIISLLLENGVHQDIHEPDNSGETPFLMAKQMEDEDVLAMFAQYDEQSKNLYAQIKN